MFAKFTKLSSFGKYVVDRGTTDYRGRTTYAKSVEPDENGVCSSHVSNYWDEGTRDYPAVLDCNGNVLSTPGQNHPHYNGGDGTVKFGINDYLVLTCFRGTRKHCTIIGTAVALARLGEFRKI